MILLLPILIYILTPVIIFWTVRLLNKKYSINISSTFKNWVMGLAIGLFLPFIFLYFIYLFDLAIDNHYDVKKGTFLWYAQMDNKTITKFPLITPIGKEKFNAIGGDSPSISTGWEIEYWSGKELNEISEKINKHLKKDGFELQEVEKEELVSSYYIESENYAVEQFYIGSNKKGESLELLIQQTAKPETKITCKIYY